MSGSLFGLLAAVSFALDAVVIRRAVLNISDASLGTLISVPMALPFFILIIAVKGQLQSIISFTWLGYVWLSVAGILHFVVGRSLYYQCSQLVGANIASILRRVNILVSVFMGITLLQEPLSWQLAIGVLLIISGITLAGLSSQMLRNSSGQFSKIPAKAFLLGLGNGVAWGLSPICIKLGLKGSVSPIAGVLISYLAATVVLSIFLGNQSRRTSIAQLKGKAAVYFFISGLFSCAANLIRFVALSLAPVSVVAPLVSTSPVFLLILSFLFNRKLEVFSKPVIIGTISVVIGGILLV
ncbi:EamA family transporter [Thermodesulfobacteriota bacterium]